MPLPYGRGTDWIESAPHPVRMPTMQAAGRNRVPIACVDEGACTLCGACQTVCPTEAITLGEAAVKVNTELCCGCGACVEVCPNGAIRLA